LIQRAGPLASGTIARCPRCRTLVRQARMPRSRARTVAFALAALALYPAAMMLPVLEVSRLGHVHEATIWSGVVALLAEGQWFVGLVVLFASIIAPIAKLAALLAVCLPIGQTEHRASAYRFVEWIGRWGMLDVLLVAILVAVVKLGDWVQVQPGPGLAAFAGVVVLSLIASAVFDPHSIWEDHP
jgi:paraquat-inducible protein A